MLTWVSIISVVLIYGSLLIGFIISIKHKFHSGTIAFGLLLGQPLINWFTKLLMDNVIEGGGLNNMTTGTFVALNVMVTEYLIKGLAYAILVFGLYRFWRGKRV